MAIHYHIFQKGHLYNIYILEKQKKNPFVFTKLVLDMVGYKKDRVLSITSTYDVAE